MRSVYNGTARDGSGNIISGATISVYLAGTTTAANIYTTLTGATSTTSVTSASNGTFSFYIDNLEYGTSQTFKITISKTGYSSNTNDNIRIEDYVLGTYSITADATVTKSLRIPEGVILQVATGVTLSINGPFEAGLYQVFSCVETGVVSFGSDSIVVYHPAWFNNATQPPVANTFPTGVITFNLSPTTAESPVGWTCTVAGTPGTWTVYGGYAGNAKALAGTDTESAITPNDLKYVIDNGGIPNATETIYGLTVYADNAEALAGTDTASAITPDDLKYVIDNGGIPNATEAIPGLTVYAGNTKALAGIDTESAITPDDLKYVIDNGITIADASISQSKLKTFTGSVSVLVSHGLGAITAALPGGEYGFLPQVKASDVGYIYFYGLHSASTLSTTYTTPGAYFYNNSPDTNYTGYAQQRYVTSSGEVFWIFILRDKTTKEVIAVFQAPDHPCFGNGGNPLLMPHPFGSYDPLIHDIIVINPSDDEVNTMRNACITPENKSDRDMIEVILEDYEIDEDSNPDWPTTPVTVGLDNSQDWKRAQDGTPVTTIKKVIKKPAGIFVKSLKKKG